jgi:hypothetical protein
LKGMEEGNNVFEEDDEQEDSKPQDPQQMTSASLSLGLRYQAALILDALWSKPMLVVEAQEIPAPPTEVQEAPPAQAEPQPPGPKNDPEVKSAKDFDKIIDSVFQQLTIADVVARLADLTKVFRVREIPRQLAIIDMMLDRLGLASFFPTLGECVQKSHESNNYVSSRLESILSRLQGSLSSKSLDLHGDSPTPISPEVEAAKTNLQREQDAEKERKRMRKEQANEELEQGGKPKPNIEVAEDLTVQPAQIQRRPAERTAV